jgi:acetyltransferase
VTEDGAIHPSSDLWPIQKDDGVEGWCLSDGTEIKVRHLRSSDRELEKQFLQSLSERSRYFRLMTPLRYLSPDLLAHLMDVDGTTRVALVAISSIEGRERFIAVARFAQTQEPGTAELGITVADAWQRRGIASRLLMLLIEVARDHGIKRLIGYVLPENYPMLALARKLGFDAHLDPPTRLVNIGIDTFRAVRDGTRDSIRA